MNHQGNDKIARRAARLAKADNLFLQNSITSKINVAELIFAVAVIGILIGFYFFLPAFSGSGWGSFSFAMLSSIVIALFLRRIGLKLVDEADNELDIYEQLTSLEHLK